MLVVVDEVVDDVVVDEVGDGVVVLVVVLDGGTVVLDGAGGVVVADVRLAAGTVEPGDDAANPVGVVAREVTFDDVPLSGTLVVSDPSTTGRRTPVVPVSWPGAARLVSPILDAAIGSPFA